MSAEVIWIGGTSYNYSITDERTGQKYSTTVSVNATPSQTSAEWIVEDPVMANGNPFPLANFHQVSFCANQSCSLTAPTASGTITGLIGAFAPNDYALEMYNGSTCQLITEDSKLSSSDIFWVNLGPYNLYIC